MARGILIAMLGLVMATAVLPLRGQTSAAPLARPQAAPAPLEVTLSYSTDRACGSSNACFWLQGGKAEFNVAFGRDLSFVGELAVQQAGNINSANEDLGLGSYLFGPRVSLRRHRAVTPFAQALIGGVHGFDAYFPVVSGASGVSDAFAFALGGGINTRLSRHLSVRPVQVDYFQTHLPNNAANRENNLRLGAGIVFEVSPRE
jgi:outer membrane immunogenic protein